MKNYRIIVARQAIFMKYTGLLFLAFLFSSLAAQREELIDEISEETCECLKVADPAADFEMSMGLCAVQAASKRTEEVEEVLDIKMTSMDQFEKLGQVIASSLVENCPYFVEKMMEGIENGDFELNEEEPAEVWSDMDAAAEATARPEYGGPENKEFITGPIPNTNGSSLAKPMVKGKIKSVREGLSNEITLKGEDGQTYRLFLRNNVSNAGLLKKGAELNIGYRIQKTYHAGEGREMEVLVITKVEK
ncbi:hypothetical protein CEQ90_00435 [Lewinellaceae bacterium SD302]|nr:hypothetical protein CEQ90_00435 [Lewinellaceae bacterium SD302]